MNTKTKPADTTDYDRAELQKNFVALARFANDPDAFNTERVALETTYRALVLIDYHLAFTSQPTLAILASPHHSLIEMARALAPEALAMGIMRHQAGAPVTPELVQALLADPEHAEKYVREYHRAVLGGKYATREENRAAYRKLHGETP